MDVVFLPGPPPPASTLTSIGVTPSTSILVGASQQFTARGTYSDESTKDITSQATWRSSASGVATVSTAGVATGISVGNTTISATFAGVTGSVPLSVLSAPLAITTASLSTGVVGATYSATLAANGGTLPYTWSLISGSLPDGLLLSAGGIIAGTPTTTGTVSFTAQVTDANQQTTNKSLSLRIISAAALTIWPASVTPSLLDVGSDTPVQLGVKFRSDVTGTVTGIRFYKSSANIGTHVGNLWMSNGVRLATITFSNETSSGWQQAFFATPVSIASNTVYVASYHVNNGHYSEDINYFSGKGMDSPPLHALASGVSGGNGVYAYGSSNVFPNQTYSNANYWVDVTFWSLPTLASIAVTPTNASVLVGTTQQFTATGRYSDGSAQNLSGQVAWTSSSSSVARISSSGLATGVSVGVTTILATLGGVTGAAPLTVQSSVILTSITVTPSNATITTGASQPFTARGTYSDGSEQNITSQATWTSSNAGVATIDAGGLALGISAGTTTVSAAFSDLTNSALLIVQATPLAIATTSLPIGFMNRIYSTTLTASGGTLPYSWSVAGGSLPAGMMLSSDGVLSGTPMATGTFSFTGRVSDAGSPTQTTNKALTLTILQPLTITTTSLLNGVRNMAYSTTLTAGGGTTPYTWSLAGGSLPAGMTLSSNGVLSGTPTATGTFSFTGRVSDAGSFVQTTNKTLILTILDPLVITTTSLPSGISNVAYSSTLTASGGKSPYTWSLIGGSLPAGLLLSQSNGVISGTPTATGIVNFIIQVKDDGNPFQTTNKSLSIAIVQLPAMTIWPSNAAPIVADGGPDSAAELGVKFRSDVDGKIIGIRFYKAGANTGSHTGNLWMSTGEWLAAVAFTNETSSGWQQAFFATPVSIASNTIYVASYHGNNGHYSADVNYFQGTGVNNPPLHALTNSASNPNGVYGYGNGSVFPAETWNAANYWVDVIFQATSVPKLMSLTVTPTNSSLTVGTTQQFTAMGRYSDGNMRDLSSQVTWNSTNAATATIQAGGLATALAAGVTTISATFLGVTTSTTLTVVSSPLVIATTLLPNGVINITYSTKLTAGGGTMPYTWSLAAGSLPTGLTLSPDGTITGRPIVMGTYSFTGRVSDAGSPTQITNKALSITIMSMPVAMTIWPTSATPTVADNGPDGAAELGVRFQSDVAGTIHGIRFYKASANTGSHTGSLWSITGVLLARAAFSNETSSGWQQAIFNPPASITNNTIYVASYHANNGHYSEDTNYFRTQGMDNLPLHALANDMAGGNGVFSYGAGSVFPIQSSNAANYWVDVLFQAGPITLASIGITPTNSSILTGATRQFTAMGTYSDGSTENLTGYAAWTSSNTGVATMVEGLATGVSVGTTTVSAALGSVSNKTTLTVKAPLAIITTFLPNGASNMTYSATLTADGGMWPYHWSLAGGSLPPGLSLNPNSGVISGTSIATGTFSFVAQVMDSDNPAQTAIKLLSISIGNQQSLAVITTILPDGITNVTYSTTLTAAGGILPYHWSVAGGGLPSGLTLNSDSGAISGKPTVTGTFSFVAQVMDSGNPAQTASNLLSISIRRLLVVPTTTLPNGISNAPYSATLTVDGGTSPYLWSFVDGSLPPGLTFNSGAISGTPTAVGTFSFVAQVADAGSPAQTTSKVFGITIVRPLVVPTNTLPNGVINVSYSATLTPSGGTSPYLWSLVGGSLPPGLTLSSGNGAISGTPTSTGHHHHLTSQWG